MHLPFPPTLLIFLVLLSSLSAADWTDRLDNNKDWGIYRGDKKAIQYSELDQVHSGNVHQLKLAWEYLHGNPSGPSMYSNPIIVDGLLYFTTPTLDVIALDASTGDQVWRFNSAPHTANGKVFRGRNRGVVYWEDASGNHERILLFVKDRVIALDARSGDMIRTFGEQGFIDLRKNLGYPPEKMSIETTTPGITYQKMLIVGSRVPEGNLSTPGDVRGYDALTGEFKWIFHTVPREGELGYDTWDWEEGETYGGANPWGGFSLDEERGWVFCATGSAAGDFIYGGNRKGQNLFANCVLALDALTGERQWHYQTIHHDIFDYDNPPAPVLATITEPDRTRDVAVQLTKMGLTFVLDRQTGEPVFPVVEMPVAASDVPGEEAWPTQPFPLLPPPLVRQVTYEADLSRITPETFDYLLKEFRKYKTGPLYTPASLQGTVTTPGHLGGVEWGGAAFDPETNVLYVNANEAPTISRLKPLDEENTQSDSPYGRGYELYHASCVFCHGLEKKGNPPLYPSLEQPAKTPEEVKTLIRSGNGIMPAFTQLNQQQVDDLIAYLFEEPPTPSGGGSNTSDSTAEESDRSPHYAQIAPFFVDQDGYPAISPPWGTLNAIDLSRGEILWKVPLGEYPELVRKGIRNTGAKNFGGPVLTAGNLIFIAATPDEKIRAFDKYTGKILWEHPLPAGGYATPSIYEINGKQFIVIAAGGGGKPGTRYGDSILAFALP